MGAAIAQTRGKVNFADATRLALTGLSNVPDLPRMPACARVPAVLSRQNLGPLRYERIILRGGRGAFWLVGVVAAKRHNMWLIDSCVAAPCPLTNESRGEGRE